MKQREQEKRVEATLHTLERNLQTYRHVMSNLTYMNAQDLTDEQLRRDLNNERRGVSYKTIDEKNMRSVLTAFAMSGDPLAEQIQAYITKHAKTRSRTDTKKSKRLTFDYQVEPLLQKMVDRSMTHKEYQGYRNGKIPIAWRSEDSGTRIPVYLIKRT